MTYREAFRRNPEFFRSIRIDRDRANSSYVMTPLFYLVLERILNGLDGRGGRALSITGPYGSGKSAAMLVAGDLVSSHPKDLISMLEVERPDLATRVNQCQPLPVLLINCGPDKLGPQISNHLQGWAQDASDRAVLGIVNKIDVDDIRSVVNAIVKITERLPGMMIVLDELGKSLEFASAHPEQADIFLLQLLAEEASRSPDEHPLMVVSILHQAFEQYAHRLIATQRDEFRKMQGRFEDMAFHLNTTTVLKLVGQSILSNREVASADVMVAVVERVRAVAIEMHGQGIAPQGVSAEDFGDWCASAAPLHPAVVVLLPALFRNLAQNERSIFGFLGSNEPFGFQQFLDITEVDVRRPRLYTLADLYDYLELSLGTSMYHGPYGRRWADLESALQRVGELSGPQNLIKTLGLVGLVSGHSLIAKGEALELLVGEPLDEARPVLGNRGVVVHRRFSNSYRLWSGSDIDIEELLREARDQLGKVSTVEVLGHLMPLKPMVARKHSMESGTLRWFEVALREPEFLYHMSSDPRPTVADGRVYFVLAGLEDAMPKPGVTTQQTWQVACWVSFPEVARKAASELYYVNWVEHHTPEIKDDETAARELRERRLLLERLVESTLEQTLFSPGKSLPVWVDGICETVPIQEFNRFLSDRCDHLFVKSPHIFSEFVNRQELSSASAAARNTLLEGMITKAHEDRLGIEGYRPELPIYLATLRDGQLHQEVDGQWRLVAPESGPWVDTWYEIVNMAEADYASVGTLWEHLSSQPFGLRAGLLPIITLAFMLVNKARLSLLEDDVFVPEITMAVVERLIKSPKKFRIRLTALSGRRAKLATEMVHAQLLPANYDERDLLGMVRPLLGFVRRLPEWTKATQRVTERSQRARQTLLLAKEPADLLFRDLPESLGFQAVDAMEDDDVAKFVASLHATIQEINEAYPALLQMAQWRLGEAFGLDEQSELAELRSALRVRALRLLEIVVNPEVRAVALRMAQDTDEQPWLEGVLSAIVGRPPKTWLDRHVQEFLVRVYETARQFDHYDAIVTALPKVPRTETVTRLGVTTADRDWETVISPSDAQRRWALETVGHIMARLLKDDFRSPHRLLLLASELIQAASQANLKEKEEVSSER